MFSRVELGLEVNKLTDLINRRFTMSWHNILKIVGCLRTYCCEAAVKKAFVLSID